MVRIIPFPLVTGMTRRDLYLISSLAPGLAVETPLRQDVRKVRTFVDLVRKTEPVPEAKGFVRQRSFLIRRCLRRIAR